MLPATGARISRPLYMGNWAHEDPDRVRAARRADGLRHLQEHRLVRGVPQQGTRRRQDATLSAARRAPRRGLLALCLLAGLCRAGDTYPPADFADPARAAKLAAAFPEL